MSDVPENSTIVLASRNKKKSEEIADLLSPHGISVVCIAEFPDVPEVIEDGESFAENAAKKATQTAKHLSQWAIGEDSGLMVDALDGAPGIFSARYSGENATDESNNAKLISEMEGISTAERGAKYVCNVALSDPEGNVQLQVETSCRGLIACEAHGENGFGYDPYFLIPEYGRTFGELGPVVKQQISHRARAFQRFIPKLIQLFQTDEISKST